QCAGDVPAPNTSLVTASDNCAGTVTVSWVSDVMSASNCFSQFTITRTYKATDVCGNNATCTQTITVNDTTPPIITCPVPVNVQCAADALTPTTSLVTASDNCAGTVTVSWVSDVMSASNCFSQFTITRTYKATDVCGNSATCTQTITVNDTTAPVLSAAPAAVTVECDAVPTAATLTATDNC